MREEAPAFEIRQLGEEDAAALWQLRLQALESEHSAFGESVEEHRRMPMDKYVARLGRGTGGDFVMGAFAQSVLIGMAGFYRDQNLKERHKGHVWGVFVAQVHRGKGVGAMLLSRLVESARRSRDLEQIQLAVATTRPAARALYASLGFHSFGLERHALKIDGEYIDEEHMVLFLR